MQRYIIGITGFANAGKDTTADYIIRKFNYFKKISFADPLKQILINYFGLTYNDVYTTEGKNSYNQFWKMTNREIMQKVGTDAMRKGFCFDVWVKVTENILLKYPNQNFIIPDIRFDNQAQMVKRNGGIVIKVNRVGFGGIVQSRHQSEQPISNNLIDFNIKNDYFDNLYCQTDIILKQIFKEES